MSFDNHQWRNEMEKNKDFDKLRRRGLWILIINEILTIISFWFALKDINWLFYIVLVYFVVSTLLLIKRIFKRKPSDESNYIFGEKLGERMKTTPQKFIYEVMMMSLSFIIITGIASSVYSIFWTEISLIYKIIIGVSGIFGALFMLMILITTFQQYKQFMLTQGVLKSLEMQTEKENIFSNMKK